MVRLAILQAIILLNPCAPAICSETCNLSDSHFGELNSLKQVDNLHWLWFYDRTFISRWFFYWSKMKWVIILFCNIAIQVLLTTEFFVILSNTTQEIGYSKETIILLGGEIKKWCLVTLYTSGLQVHAELQKNSTFKKNIYVSLLHYMCSIFLLCHKNCNHNLQVYAQSNCYWFSNAFLWCPLP